MNERITRLETQLAFQEDLLDQLNKIVTHQQDQIDALRREIDALRDDLERAGEEPRDPALEKPPHY